jgi:multiple sugar transport system permease protein
MSAQPITRRSQRLFVAALLTPALALVGLFVIGPIFVAVFLSVTNEALTGPAAKSSQFVGLENYANLLADDAFIASMGRSVIFVFFSAIVGQFLLGLAAALVLARKGLVGKGLFGAAILLPLVIPETVAALAWASMLAPGNLGTLNRLGAIVGMNPIAWLIENPMLSIIIVNIWRGVAFAMILFSAAIEGIPHEVTEAAMVDGASPRQQVTQITLPLIKPAVLLYMLLTTIDTFGVFGLIYFLTRGGPGGETTVASIYIYQQAFKYFEVGLGSAASVILLAVVLSLGLVYVRLLRAQV